MLQGYIKLYRQLLDNPLWDDKPFSRGQAWVDLMLRANHAEGKMLCGSRMVSIPRGSLITSEASLMERWGWSKTKVRGFLKLLESERMIDRNADRNKTTISLRNYSDFQTLQTTKEPQKDREKTAEEPQKNLNKNDKNKKNDKAAPPISSPEDAAGEESTASSGEGLTVEKAGGAAETADHPMTRMDDSFTRFWDAYPRKVAKQEAAKAWSKIKVDEALQGRILAALDAQKKSDQWTRENGKYIPHPATWLRGRRWEDEIKPASTPGAKPSYAGYDLDLVQQILDMENGE